MFMFGNQKKAKEEAKKQQREERQAPTAQSA
jgi:hypothetical protein